MQKKIGPLLALILLALFISVWFFLTLDDWKRGGFNYRLKGLSSCAAILGYLLFSYSLLLSSRWRYLESWFGSLDHIYHIHRLAGLWGFVCIAVHPFLASMKFLFHNFRKFILFYFPFHREFSVNLGSYAFWLMALILAITILKIFPYDKWKITHKFMSLSFILASFHFLVSSQLFGNIYLTKFLLSLPMLVGFASILQKQLIYPFFKEFPSYRVTNVEKLNNNHIEIAFEPKDKEVSFLPGQYGFFSFQGPSHSKESHPFTFLGTPEKHAISILVKARGDFTKDLYKTIKKGDLAKIEGPYGKFDYTKAHSKQVWIAGGIGIAPFLSWAREFQTSQTIDLFYAVHFKEDNLFEKEFREASGVNREFQYHLFCSEKGERITASLIEKNLADLLTRSILMCGPKRLTQDLLKQFVALGIPRKNIYFEDFEFF